jgi:Domain of unknown function (DUF4371)
MVLVIRFVHRDGSVVEKFLEIVHVMGTTSISLMTSICSLLVEYNLSLLMLRGQSYDGASKMQRVRLANQGIVLEEW